MTNVHGWRGGWSPAARFLVPVAPFLGLALALGISRTPRIITGAILAAQACMDGYFWSHPKLLWSMDGGVTDVSWAIPLALLATWAGMTAWMARARLHAGGIPAPGKAL
jgi:hypothetical protein